MESRTKEDLRFDSLCNGCISAGYIKAEEVLPEELIRRIQEYADGVYIYIPRKPGTQHAWGQETDYKSELKIRNDRIRRILQKS